MTLAPYTIRNCALVLRDTPEHLDFHVRSGDYFATVATLVGFLEETAHGGGSPEAREQQAAMARELRQDLVYLQQHYKIVRKE